ncbi:MAG: hypothetical protein H7255_03410 [Ramlibacter sp.]|nr:hypothetical protein [Ramlibacter sp.]
MKNAVFAAIALASLVNSAFAATALPAQSFNVTATIAAKCRNVTVGTPVVDFGVYTAFAGPANVAPSAQMVFECSQNLAPVSAVLDATTGTLVGVTYNLTMGAPATGAGAAGSTSYTYTVGGTMVLNQAGDATGATTDARTLTVSY